MKPKHSILLVEDEEESAEMLTNFLEMNDYNVLTAYEGNRALEIIDEYAGEIHLAILDIMVPNVDGKEICKHIRRHPVLNDIPVIFLTAKDEEQDEIEGLELGADDYIPKPASLNLVKAHVESLLRRQNPQTANWLQYGDTYLDTDAKQLYVDNEEVELTSTEYTLIELLYQNPKRVYTRQEILEHITEEDQFVFDRTVDVHVKNLRLKMGDAGEVIKTYRGIGYGLNREIVKV
ncbi:two-component system, OmpR family, phosphate regulon response regulator PhoB [Fodinibius salinus]|uniref:Two-component system, OmpR family, phosphate regulon response regulator PhoB n=1 Tax=Fodinibius salinus TaxID=860790 RepID=A0A5D3YIJ8_9BACT|nr:response regulator transcription factor [Fodinibius salinus]TYP93318.1 two-component system, OmpR family, phosphate regulon response regulator PhoB [Fodinibius salinus]